MTLTYEVNRYTKTMSTKDFYDKYADFNRVQGYCTQCARYDTNYSCSPLDIDTKEFILNYDYIDVTLTKLDFKKEDYEKEYTDEEFENVLKESFYPETNKTKENVFNQEKNYKKAISITGPCTLCDVDCRKEYDECIHPEKMRYSLASLGVDSRMVIEKLFNVPLIPINENLSEHLENNEKLSKPKLPKYMNNVTSILYSKN